MKLTFIIDDDYLLHHTISGCEHQKFSSEEHKKDLMKLFSLASEKSERMLLFCIGNPYPDNILNNLKNLSKYIHELQSTNEFKKIRQQTERYKKWLEKEWLRNEKETTKFIEEITGFTLDKDFTIYVTHPSLKNGLNWRNGIISWGHFEEYKGYSIVYLWHEILHSYFPKNDLTHAVIELICDNELRYTLSSIKYPPIVGHKNLFSIKKGLIQSWKKYLKSNAGNISLFIRDSQKNK